MCKKIWTDLSFVLSQCTRLTDRQTDGQIEFSSLDRVCIPWGAVKTGPLTKTLSLINNEEVGVAATKSTVLNRSHGVSRCVDITIVGLPPALMRYRAACGRQVTGPVGGAVSPSPATHPPLIDDARLFAVLAGGSLPYSADGQFGPRRSPTQRRCRVGSATNRSNCAYQRRAERHLPDVGLRQCRLQRLRDNRRR